MEVAFGLELDVDERMAGQLLQHMVDEADAGLDVIDAAAVEIDARLDLGLGGLAFDAGLAHGLLTLCCGGSLSALPGEVPPFRCRQVNLPGLFLWAVRAYMTPAGAPFPA